MKKMKIIMLEMMQKRFINLVGNEKSIIVVDDYRIDNNWIKAVKKKKSQINNI